MLKKSFGIARCSQVVLGISVGCRKFEIQQCLESRQLPRSLENILVCFPTCSRFGIWTSSVIPKNSSTLILSSLCGRRFSKWTILIVQDIFCSKKSSWPLHPIPLWCMSVSWNPVSGRCTYICYHLVQMFKHFGQLMVKQDPSFERALSSFPTRPLYMKKVYQ